MTTSVPERLEEASAGALLSSQNQSANTRPQTSFLDYEKGTLLHQALVGPALPGSSSAWTHSLKESLVSEPMCVWGSPTSHKVMLGRFPSRPTSPGWNLCLGWVDLQNWCCTALSSETNSHSYELCMLLTSEDICKNIQITGSVTSVELGRWKVEYPLTGQQSPSLGRNTVKADISKTFPLPRCMY